MNQKKIIFVVGPTAIGKSDVAFVLAQKRRGEIVSCDSMQIYKKISIVTNKPSRSILRKVPHHLIDIVSVEKEFDVASFNQLATEAIEQIHAKNKLPVVVGGSGMYMQVLLDGIFEGGGKDLRLRQALKEQAKEEGAIVLYEKLRKVDPEAASKIHPNDLRRIIRALEVFIKMKKPISELHKLRAGLWGRYDISVYALNQERALLYNRINERVEKMIAAGVMGEIKKIEKAKLSLTAQRIIGVQEILGYLKGDYDIDQAKKMMKLNTRRLAKRQLTWFRKDKRLKWIEILEGESAPCVAEKILKDFG